MAERLETNHLVVHGAWTPVGMDIGAEEIRDWHLERGFRDIGYHYVIRRDGLLEDGRPLEQVGAHVRGHNHDSVGVCLVGGKPDEVREDWQWEFNYTGAQLVTLREIVEQLKKLYPDAEIRGHRDFDGVVKLCPGFNVNEWWIQ